MASFSFVNPDDGQTITINGPPSLDRDAARRIFNQQRESGVLIGLQRGDTINAASQTFDGLVTAEAQLLQQLSQQPSQAEQSTPAKTIAEVLTKFPVTDGITLADYVKQPVADVSIGGLSSVELTAVLAQLHRLVNQPATVLTQQGLGSYALSVPQLAAANYVKAAVVPLFETGQSSIVSILKSPNSWTGLNGIKTAQDLLLSDNLQQQIQLTLMSAALVYLQDIGIDIEKLPSRSQAGAVLSVAKAPELATAWLQGQQVPAEAVTLFSQYVRDGAYAVDFANNKVSSSVTNEYAAPGYINVNNRAKLDAATTRIVGNKKIPQLRYGTDAVDPAQLAEFNQEQTKFVNIQTAVNSALSQTTTVQNAALRQAQLENYQAQLKTLTIELSKLAANVSESTALFDSVNLLLRQVAVLLTRINEGIQFVNSARSQLQRR